MNRLDQLKRALLEADTQGRQEDVDLLRRAIINEQSKGGQQAPNPYADRYEANGSFGAAGRGVQRSLERTGEGLTDLFYRATGNEDALERLTKRAEQKEAAFDGVEEQYPVATTIGEVGGELAQLAVPAGAISKIGTANRLIQGANRTFKGRAALAASEGFVVDSLTTRGDTSERLSEGGQGALFSVAGQAGSDALGGLYKSARRSFDKGNQQQLDKDLFAREDSLAQKNIESAREDGGFELDTADAYASISRQEGILGDVALADKKQAARPIDSTLHTFNSEQDAAIRDKAFELTRKLSNTSSEISLEDAGDGIKSALKDIKQSDFARASEKYDLWAETAEAQTIPLNVENVKGDLDKLLRETSARFDKSTSSSLRDTLGYYGLLGDNAQEVLTAGNYEKLLQDINRKWNPNASGSQNEPISLVHDFLRERQPNILAGTSDIPQEAIALGRAAAENWKLVSQKWNANEIAQKLTTTKKKSDDDTLTGFAAATHLLNPRKVSDLQKLKGLLQLDKNESSQKAWAGIQQAPLFKAIREATKGKDSFDAAAFSSVIDSYGYKTLETLYGKSQFLELKKAISAWNLRGKKLPVGSSLAEQSNGIVNAVANLSVRILSSTGLLRNGGQVALAAPSVNNALSRKLAVDKQEVNSEALISGQQTIRQLDKRREEVLKAYEDILGEDSFLRFQPYAAALARAYSREGNE